MKRAGNFLLLFAFVCAVAAGSGLISYSLAVRMMNKRETESVVSAGNGAADERRTHATKPETYETAAENAPVVTKAVYYMVRLEGESLGVYACDEEKEEFLYNEKIYTNDLSQQDFVTLEEGVKLDSLAELTGFIENFTS